MMRNQWLSFSGLSQNRRRRFVASALAILAVAIGITLAIFTSDNARAGTNTVPVTPTSCSSSASFWPGQPVSVGCDGSTGTVALASADQLTLNIDMGSLKLVKDAATITGGPDDSSFPYRRALVMATLGCTASGSGCTPITNTNTTTYRYYQVNLQAFGRGQTVNVDANYGCGAGIVCMQWSEIAIVTTMTDRTLDFATTAYNLTFGSTQTVSVAASNGGGTITYSAGSSTACTVNASTGLVTASSGVGTCSITASITADNLYNSATSTTPVTVTVSKAAQATMTLSSTALSMTWDASTGWTRALTLTTSGGSGAGAVTYTTATGNAAAMTGCALDSATNPTSISAVGVVASTTYSMATCTITATKAGGDNYLDSSRTVTFTFNKKPLALPVTSVQQAWAGTSDGLRITVTSIDPNAGNTVVKIEPSNTGFAYVGVINPLIIGDNYVSGLSPNTTYYLNFDTYAPSGPNSEFYARSQTPQGSRIAVTTNPATAAPVITTQPADFMGFAAVPGSPNLSVTVTPPTTGVLSYQWQQSTDGGTAFADIAGATSSTYRPATPGSAAIALTWSGYKYRVKVTNTDNTVPASTFSNAATTYYKYTQVLYQNTAKTTSAVATSNAYLDQGTVDFTNWTSISNDPVTVSVTTPAVCSVSNKVVTLITTGSCIVKLDVAETTVRYSLSYTHTMTVGSVRQAQSLTFNKPADATFGDAAVTLAATTTSGLAATFSSSTIGVCTVSGTTLTFVAAGTCTVTASQVGDATYAAAAQVAQSLTVAQKSLTITATLTASEIVTGGTLPTRSFTPTGLVGANTVSSVTYTWRNSSNTVIPSMNSTTPGSFTLTPSAAVFGGGGVASNYSITYVNASLSIRGSQTITFSAISNRTYGDASFTLPETLTSASLTISYSSATTGVCSVTGAQVSIVAAGTCTLNANQAGTATVAPATQVSRSFTVATKALTITPTLSASTIFAGGASPVVGYLVSGIVGSDAIGSVVYSYTDSSNTVSATSPSTVGTYSVGVSSSTFSSGSASNYTITYGTVSLTVVPAQTAPTAPIVNGTLVGLNFVTVTVIPPSSDGGSAITRYEYRYKLATSASPATFDNNTASWSSINSAAWTAWATTPTLTNVMVGSTPAKSFNIPGTPNPQAGLWNVVEVRAVNAIGTSPTSVQRPNTVDVSFPTDGSQSGDGFIKFNFRLTYDGNAPILRYEYALVTAGNQTLNWVNMNTTSDAQPFSVTGLTNGTAYNVRVRAVNAYGSLEGQSSFAVSPQSVTPNKPQPTGTLSFTNVIYAPNLTVTPTTATRTGDGAISWSSQYTSVCTVDNTGTVTVVTAGNCLIYMDVAEGTTTGPRSFSAWLMIFKATQAALSWNVSSTSGAYLSTITLDTTGGTGTGLVSYQKAIGSTCSLTGNVVTLSTVGSTCSISATKAADANYNSTSVPTNISLTSTKASQAAVSFSNSSSMSAGQTLTLQANGGSGTGAFSFSVTGQGTTGCSLSGAVLSASTTGTCTVSVTRLTSTNYLDSAAVTQSITVNPVSQTVQFTSNVPAQPIAAGTYTPTATASSGLTAQLSIVSGQCAIASGVVTFNASGTCVIAANQAGNSVYSAATQVTQSVSVGQRNQALSFKAATNSISTKTFGDLAFIVEATSTEPAAVITYSVSPNTTNGACSVTSSGLVSVLAVGTCAISADSPSTASFAAASTITKTISVLSDQAGAPTLGSVSGGNLSATLGFYAPGYTGGSAITGYQVVAIDQTQGSTVEVVESACSTVATNGLLSCRVTGLTNGTSYRLKVAVINAAGLGAYSLLSGPVTVATNPSAVQNLSVTEGNLNLTIRWSAPDSLGGGTFSAYRIFIKRSDAASYDQNHFFNVTSQSTTSATVTRESPPDGMTFNGGPLLQNGVAYDVKVVTVTTANLLELESNTAVVNQIPHTVPDAPAVANSIAVGNQLVITWTTPLSDGGKPVTAYTVTVDNNSCTLANPTDLSCSVALPTTPGSYVFEVRAVNAAGTSVAVSGSFQVAASVSSGGGSSNPTNPTTPTNPVIAPVVNSVALATDGKTATILGKGLASVKSVSFGSIVVKLSSKDDASVVALSDGLRPGTYDLMVTFEDGTVLRLEKALVISGAPTKPTVKTSQFRVPGFANGASSLSVKNRAAIVKFLKASKGIKFVECIGSTEGPTVLRADARLAMKRGSAVCAVAKQLGIKVHSVSYVNRLETGPAFRSVELRVTR
jgi:hypothetical protein